MKRRLSAVLLALGLTVSALSMGVYAEEAETAATEQVTEAVTEAETAAESEVESEAETAAESEAETVSQEEMIKQVLASQLEQLSAMTDEQLEAMVESTDVTTAAIAANWNSVKEELGAFVEVTDAQLNAEGTEITGHAKYDKIDEGTEVTVVYSINAETQTATINWTVDYPMSVLMKQAGLNTVMGLGIVFLTLAFLAWLIGQLHIIPDMIEKMSGKKKPEAEAHEAAPAAAPEPVVAEEEYVDDLELVAVITAAIAASENTSSDGFVVRSIKKANKKNWQRA